jgi:hypothetical protein
MVESIVTLSYPGAEKNGGFFSEHINKLSTPNQDYEAAGAGAGAVIEPPIHTSRASNKDPVCSSFSLQRTIQILLHAIVS